MSSGYTMLSKSCKASLTKNKVTVRTTIMTWSNLVATSCYRLKASMDRTSYSPMALGKFLVQVAIWDLNFPISQSYLSLLEGVEEQQKRMNKRPTGRTNQCTPRAKLPRL
jgi:hypothetical protein